MNLESEALHQALPVSALAVSTANEIGYQLAANLQRGLGAPVG